MKLSLCKALGIKAHSDPKIADQVCYVRGIWIAINLVTCLFIVAGVIRHW